ncbi:FH2 domain-containing protein 1-like [Astyanax mexicanus]|uniref:FH2 domain-containing protein 1-like n=1 Tax=Astyanax mexicanus TaxID=7994 RepID=A0A8T2MNJ9_ASTMX|nr:FH2 domain-containing protein 1-like [Astyanax mexicanus]
MTEPNPVVPAVVPPPPPPPLPPPPPPPVLVNSTSRSAPGSGRLRSVFWERIPQERVKGRRSVWTKSDEYLIDFTSLDELFGQQQGNKGKESRVKSLHGQEKHTNTLRKNTLDKISILEGNRKLKVGIFLHHFKSTLGEIINDIREGRGQNYGSEKLNELFKLLPDPDEEQLLRAFRGERSQLEEADLFLLHLVEIPSFRLRLEAMILQEDFECAVSTVSTSAQCLVCAATELMGCVELHFILRLVLKAGNYMNAGGFAGNAAGFRIASLLKLSDTKANRPGMNLLHFVAMEAVKKDPLIFSYHLKLSHVGPASRLSVEVVLEEFSELQCRVAALKERVRTTSDLLIQITPFLQAAELKLSEVQLDVDSMVKAQQSLLEFFCEDDDGSFKLEEACSSLHIFNQRFHRAAQENMLREQQYQRRLEREHMERQRVLKHRSIASCSILEAGLECNDGSLEMILEASVTSPRRRSQWSTLGRQTLQRPSLFSLTETTAEKTNLMKCEVEKCTDVPDSGAAVEIRTETPPNSKLTEAKRLAHSAIQPQNQTLGSGLRPQVGEKHTLVSPLQSYSSLAPPCAEEERKGRKPAVKGKSKEMQQEVQNLASSEVGEKKTGNLKERTMKDMKPANQSQNRTRIATPPLRASHLPLLQTGLRPLPSGQSVTAVGTSKEEGSVRKTQRAKIPQSLKRLLDRTSSSKKEREKKEGEKEVKEKTKTETNDKQRERREREKEKNKREQEKQQEKERQKREKEIKEREKKRVKSEKEREKTKVCDVKEGRVERSAGPGSSLALTVPRPLSRLCPSATPLALALHSVLKRDRNGHTVASSSRIPSTTSRGTQSQTR